MKKHAIYLRKLANKTKSLKVKRNILINQSGKGLVSTLIGTLLTSIVSKLINKN